MTEEMDTARLHLDEPAQTRVRDEGLRVVNLFAPHCPCPDHLQAVVGESGCPCAERGCIHEAAVRAGMMFEAMPTFANTGELLRHDPGCRCWPHVSEQDALDAVAAVGLAEYRDGKRAELYRTALRGIILEAEEVTLAQHGNPISALEAIITRALTHLGGLR